MRYLIISFALIIASCQPTEDRTHPHDDDSGQSLGDQGGPAMSFTIWTDQTELFVEFPALTVGQTSGFAAHFTILDGHQPVREGMVTVSLINGDKGIRHTVETPSSPGIFLPSLRPIEPGIYQLAFDLKTSSYSDKMVINDVQVYASPEEAVNAMAGDEEQTGAITFLKEQAWKVEFQTTPMKEKKIYETVPTSGIWKVAPSHYQTLAAPADGLLNFKQVNLIEGGKVKRGQALMTISSEGLTTNNLNLEILKAKSEFEQVKSEYERKKNLYTSKIVPKAEFERVEQKYRVTKANYETLSAGYSAGGKQVMAPFDGYIKSISVMNGEFVEQGTELVTITSHQSSLLETQVSPTYASRLQYLQDIWYQPAEGVWSSLKQKGGAILSVGREVNAEKPMISVFARVNEAIEMPEGSFTEVQLTIGSATMSPVVPVSALLEDYGNYSVIVQLSGERFEQRNVTPGKRNGNEVEIIQGLTLGEVVVTKGGYQVKMAAMSGQAPAHGHAH